VGGRDALAEAYDRWATLIHSLAMRITADRAAAEDVTQDVFVHLWQYPDRYDPQRGALRTWLCLLARSRAVDWVRRRRAQDHCHAAAAAIAPPPAEVDDGIVWQAEAKVVRERWRRSRTGSAKRCCSPTTGGGPIARWRGT
jgi:RNA polymerase sigma factor (sigma-70 family)